MRGHFGRIPVPAYVMFLICDRYDKYEVTCHATALSTAGWLITENELTFHSYHRRRQGYIEQNTWRKLFP
jgi:hypothetical protein